MARESNKLNPAEVGTLGPGTYNDGDGLYLLVKPAGSRSWIYRFHDRVSRTYRDKGLGSARQVPLKAARKMATALRADLLKGINPIDAARQSLAAARAAHAGRVTFGQCATTYIEEQGKKWKSAKHRKQWTATLDDYCADWWNVPVNEIDTPMVKQVLISRWESHPETASRVQGRIARIFDWATVLTYRSGENPARWKGKLSTQFERPSKKKVTHRPALPYSQMPALMAELRKKDSTSSRALQLQILTATRPGEAVGAQWEEFDVAAKVWTIPAYRTKTSEEHKVPLTQPVLSLLKQLHGPQQGPLFTGVSAGRSITTAATMKLLKSLRPGYTCHGFRSTFRDWAAENTAEGDVAEAALAHVLKNQTVAAYLRTKFFDKRVVLMAKWAKHCSPAKLQ